MDKVERPNLHKKAPVEHIDYKDITRLGALVNPHARILNRRRTGFSAKAQRDLSTAVKRARFMALMAYIQH
jgi:small subunit ribosomal protein S18